MVTEMDLATLVQPRKISVPSVGELLVDVHGTFQSWLAHGFDRGRWADGNALIVAVLQEQSKTLDGVRPAPDTVAGLNDADLEKAAGAFLTVAASSLRPRWIQREPAGRRARARVREEHEAYDLSAREGETERARLYRLAQDWRADRALRDAEMAAMVLGSGYGDLIETARQQAAAIDRLTRPIDALKSMQAGLVGPRAISALQASAISMAEKAMRGMDVPGIGAAQSALRGIDFSAMNAVGKVSEASACRSSGLRKRFLPT